jgi:hypothetical protein
MTTEGVARPARRLGRKPERPVLVRAMGDLAAAADLAPSPLEVRPWRLRNRGGAVELLADTTATADNGPEQPRQTVIACGAALLNLRLAVAHLDVEPVVTLLPAADQPELLARVEAGPSRERTPAEEQLYLALGERRTKRSRFSHPFVPQEVMARLTEAVSEERADLVAVASANRLRTLNRITAALRPTAGAPDGLLPGWSAEVAGDVLLLVTPGDGVLDWLHAGQALQRLLLTATTAWLQTTFHTRVLEVPALREEVRRRLCPGQAPQVILELGRRSASAA